MTTIAVPMVIFYRWHGVEDTVGASSAEYTLGNALPACFQQPFPLHPPHPPPLRDRDPKRTGTAAVASPPTLLPPRMHSVIILKGVFSNGEVGKV